MLLTLGVALALGCKRAARRFPALGRWQMFVIPGAICWFGLQLAGLHAALALAFVVPFISIRDSDEGLLAEKDDVAPGSINLLEQAHKPFVDTGLFYFGLANGGVAWWGSSAWDQNSWSVFLGLGIGKTLGITAFVLAGFLVLKLTRGGASLPTNVESGERQRWQDVPLIGLLGATGFTVALFVAEAVGGHASLKLGALASFEFLGLAVVPGNLATVRRK